MRATSLDFVGEPKHQTGLPIHRGGWPIHKTPKVLGCPILDSLTA
jgi:hypothetical protein